MCTFNDFIQNTNGQTLFFLGLFILIAMYIVFDNITRIFNKNK